MFHSNTESYLRKIDGHCGQKIVHIIKSLFERLRDDIRAEIRILIGLEFLSSLVLVTANLVEFFLYLVSLTLIKLFFEFFEVRIDDTTGDLPQRIFSDLFVLKFRDSPNLCIGSFRLPSHFRK